jgi:FkbM family methyltransferase
MASLKTLLSILKTTNNFWVVPSLRWSGATKKVVFRNGFEREISWRDYRILRDIFSEGYLVEPYNEMLCFKKGNTKIVGVLPDVGVIAENWADFRSIDFAGKVVLDVGGFIGDTAVLFSSLGARKVIIYEPVQAHQEIIKINVALNGVNAEIHDEGLGETDGFALIRYENEGVDFGLKNEGTKEIKIKIKSARRIIEESAADVAKFDCEGAEISLVNVPDEVIKRISSYIIEVHSFEIRSQIITKFRNCGFILNKEVANTAGPQFSVLIFKRNWTTFS